MLVLALLRLYRLLPRRLRTRLVDLVPRARQLWLARKLLRIHSRSGWIRRRRRAGWLRVRDGGELLWARVSADATPLAVRQHNLDAVVGLLEKANIPYFCVGGYDLRSVVAVHLADQDRVLRLLRTAPALTGGYVRLVGPSSSRSTSGRQAVARVFLPITDDAGNWVLGRRYRCDVQFWELWEGQLVGPGVGRAYVVPVTDPSVDAPASAFSRFLGSQDGEPRYRTRAVFARTRPDHVTFPIDAVYTRVDGADPLWRRRKNTVLATHGRAALNNLAANGARYASRDELRYSLRSLMYFAPWIRNIYLVTDDQLPPWLDVSHPKITLVRHREIFGDAGSLPTFNSHAIESRLHHIPGLAEHFVYFNDDMFLGCPVIPQTFFHANGITKFFASPAQVDPGPATVDDPPVTAAAKNNRRHIMERFGRYLARKMRHVPYPLRRSVLAEIEAELPADVLATAAHPFRHPGDLSIPSSLAHYWAFLSGQAVPGSIRYTYADLGDPFTPLHLAKLLSKRNEQVFCLNDTDFGTSSEESLEQGAALLREFLSAYFPFRAPFEYPDPVSRQRAAYSATELARRALQEANGWLDGAPATSMPAHGRRSTEELLPSGVVARSSGAGT